MKRILIALSLVLLSGLVLPHPGSAEHGASAFATADDFQVRSETHLGCRKPGFTYVLGDIPDDPSAELGPCMAQYGVYPAYPFTIEQCVRLEGNSKGFIDIPRMASKFVAENSDTVVVITFSGMQILSTVDDEPLIVRTLVDGQEAQPGPIVLSSGFSQTQFGANSFTFTTTVGKGIHIVQMQWSSESNTKRTDLRNASLFISVDSQHPKGHRVVAKARRLVTPVDKASANWTAIPHAELTFDMPEDGAAALTISTVLKMNGGDNIFVRAVIGGAATAMPTETTLASKSYHLAARSLTFTTGNLSPGSHKVRFEWKSSMTDVVASASLHAWSASAITAPAETKDSSLTVVAQKSPSTATPLDFLPVPDLETKVKADAPVDVAVTFSAAFAGEGVVIATVTRDGEPQSEMETILYEASILTDNNGTKHVLNGGGQSYTFAIKDLPPKNAPYKLGVAFRVTGDFATVYNATMTVITKHRIGPDLAVGANMAGGSGKREALIEPAHGKRKVLTIIFDPDRPDAPEPDAKYVDGVERVLFGDPPSAADYYNVVSGGRFTLENAGVLGPYKGQKAGGTTNNNHYWDKSAHDPDGDRDCKDSTDAYCSPWDEQIAEAITRASNDFDFSAQDLDRNGVITSDELGILVVTPQKSATGSATFFGFTPYIDPSKPLMTDGVIIKYFMHWYTPGIVGDGSYEYTGLDSAMVAAHEMAHLFLYLDDVYTQYSFKFDSSGVQECSGSSPAPCQKRFVNTSPHPVSMMTYYTVTSSPHIDAFHKLQLGWVTPRIVIAPSELTLPDVKNSKEVLVLPRYGKDGREYFLLETRYETDLQDDPLYDFSIRDSGLAVYHIIEPGPKCKSPDGATANNCDPMQKPMCITSNLLWNKFADNFARPGLRLIQPDITHPYYSTSIDFDETLFGDGSVAGMELLDTTAGAMICPMQVGDPPPIGAKPLLLWSNGNASGYRLKAIKLDYPAKSVSFAVEIDWK